MKQLVYVIAFLFGFSINGLAQENKAAKTQKMENYEIEAQKDAKKISKFLKLDDTASNEVYLILKSKEGVLVRHPEVVEIKERMAILEQSTTTKLKKILTQEQYDKLVANYKLFQLAIK